MGNGRKSSLNAIGVKLSTLDKVGPPRLGVADLPGIAAAQAPHANLNHSGNPRHFRRPSHRAAVPQRVALYDITPVRVCIDLQNSKRPPSLVSLKDRDGDGIVPSQDNGHSAPL